MKYNFDFQKNLLKSPENKEKHIVETKNEDNKGGICSDGKRGSSGHQQSTLGNDGGKVTQDIVGHCDIVEKRDEQLGSLEGRHVPKSELIKSSPAVKVVPPTGSPLVHRSESPGTLITGLIPTVKEVPTGDALITNIKAHSALIVDKLDNKLMTRIVDHLDYGMTNVFDTVVVENWDTGVMTDYVTGVITDRDTGVIDKCDTGVIEIPESGGMDVSEDPVFDVRAWNECGTRTLRLLLHLDPPEAVNFEGCGNSVKTSQCMVGYITPGQVSFVLLNYCL